MSSSSSQGPIWPIQFSIDKHNPTVLQWDDGWFEGWHVFGATGTGKTRGAGRAIATTLGELGDSDKTRVRTGLILTAKETDGSAFWDDVPGINKRLTKFTDSRGKFNFLRVATEVTGGGAHDIAAIFMAALSRGDTAVSGQDPFWDNALRELLVNTIDLCLLRGEAEDRKDAPYLTLTQMSNIIRSDASNEGSWCREHIKAIKKGASRLSAPRHLDFNAAATYWLSDFAKLDPRTRSNIVSSFAALAVLLDRSPMREWICADPTKGDLFQECFNESKVLLLDIPYKKYGETGRLAQVIVKTLWQRFIEKKAAESQNPASPAKPSASTQAVAATPTPEGGQRPTNRWLSWFSQSDAGAVTTSPTTPDPAASRESQEDIYFLWADESQYFITREDALFQQTARQSRVVTVYLTQNLSSYYAMLGGDRAVPFVQSLLGNLRNRVFFQNADTATNEWASNSFGKLNVAGVEQSAVPTRAFVSLFRGQAIRQRPPSSPLAS